MSRQAPLTPAQLKKFVEGYNRFVEDSNKGISTSSSPYRRATWGDFGHDYARMTFCNRQLAGELNIKMESVTPSRAQEIWVNDEPYAHLLSN